MVRTFATIFLALSAAAWAAEETAVCPVCNGKGRVEQICKTCRDSVDGKASCPFCRGKSAPDWPTLSENELAHASPGDGTIVCKDCRGRGIVPGLADGVMKCPTCGGARRFKCPKCDKGKVLCPDCKGKGKWEVDCPRCNGAGKISPGGGSDGTAAPDKTPLSLEAKRLKLQLEIVQLQEAIENLKKRLAEVEVEIAKSKAEAGRKRSEPEPANKADADAFSKPAPGAEPKKPVDKRDDF